MSDNDQVPVIKDSHTRFDTSVTGNLVPIATMMSLAFTMGGRTRTTKHIEMPFGKPCFMRYSLSEEGATLLLSDKPGEEVASIFVEWEDDSECNVT